MFAVGNTWRSERFEASQEFLWLNRGRRPITASLHPRNHKRGFVLLNFSTRSLFTLLINSNCPIKDNLLHSHALVEPELLNQL